MKKIHLGGKHGSIIGNELLVDDEDYEWLNQWKWYAWKNGNTFYARMNVAVENKKQKGFLLHRVLFGLTDPEILCDHRDHNGLNNQRYNLRIANKSQNAMNRRSLTGKTKGVIWNEKYKRYEVYIRKDKILKRLGNFTSKIKAENAYNKAATELFGEFACLNNL